MPISKEIFKKPAVIIIFTLILILFSSWPAYLLVNWDIISIDGLWFPFVIALSALISMFVLPALVIRHFFKENLSDYGLLLVNGGQIIKYILVPLILSLPLIFFLASKPSFEQYYFVKDRFHGLYILSILWSAVYYFSEEFIFRGFLFFGLWNRLKIHSFWITNLIFAIFHLGKPHGEMFIAFFSGIYLSYITYKTKSFVPAAIIHFIFALVLNIVITFVYLT